MSYKIATLSLIAPLALAACTEGPDRAPDLRAPAATAIGEPINCIATNRIRDTKVHDDYTIDFQMVDGALYRNSMTNRCAGLGFAERFGYEVRTAQLCNTDTITVLPTGGGIPGPTCGLEKFVPIKLND